MELIRVKDYQEMSQALNRIFTEQIKRKPDSVLSFTTGATPAGLAELLVEEVNRGLDISRTVMMNLDEYVGKRDGKYSVYRWMHEHIYDKLNMQPGKIFMMNAEAEDQKQELERYAQILSEYPRDIQLLGLGQNAHIGANEPGTPFTSSLFVADSRESTIEATMALFGLTREETPKQMYTMGFKEIMEAQCVVLAASGKSKADAVKQIVEGGIDEMVPASYLKNHEQFIFIVDDDAASLLEQP